MNTHQSGGIGVGQKVRSGFPKDGMGEPERTFWPTQYNERRYRAGGVEGLEPP